MPHSSSYPPQYGGYQPPGKSPPPDPFGPVDKDGMADLLTPRTVVQLAVWVLMFGLGAGLSGLILFAIYQGQVNNLRAELLDSQEELQKSLEERIGSAPAPEESPNLNVSGAAPVDPTKQLVQIASPAIVGVSGIDSANRGVSGSGFVVNSTDDGTWVLTSNSLVAGVNNVSDLSIRHRNSNLVGEVYETDPGRDLALVIYRVAAERSLRFSRVAVPKEGDPVWALGNTKSNPYAAGIEAKLTSVTSAALGIDTEVPDAYIGGPLIDADGRVVGVLSKSPAASGGETKASATPIELACSRVLRCPSNNRDRTAASPTPGGEAASPAPETAPSDAAPEGGPEAVDQPPASNPNTADVPIG